MMRAINLEEETLIADSLDPTALSLLYQSPTYHDFPPDPKTASIMRDSLFSNSSMNFFTFH
jgi:hypothetical protein